MEQFPQPKIEKEISKLKELVSGEPEAIFILTGAMKYSVQKGRYESGSFSDKDENSGLATGGKDRMLAVAKLHDTFPEATVVPMSRTRSEDLPTYASVMKAELLRNGVAPEVIMEESESVDTITSFKQAAQMSAENGWKNLIFVSSSWHLPRSEALFNHLENFADTNEEEELLTRFADKIRSGELRVQFLGSSDILMAEDEHYRALFEKVAADPGIQSRVVLEEKALVQIKSGSYGKYSLTKKIFSE